MDNLLIMNYGHGGYGRDHIAPKIQSDKIHRSYIRRKRCLGEISKRIKSVLYDLSVSTGEKIDDGCLSDKALKYAKTIEAACWSPRMHFSEESYQQLIHAKTTQLCRVLFNEPREQTLPSPKSPSLSDNHESIKMEHIDHQDGKKELPLLEWKTPVKRVILPSITIGSSPYPSFKL